MKRLLGALVLGCFGAAFLAIAGCTGTENVAPDASSTSTAPTAATPAAPAAKTELATFGAGCFWGVESTFQRVPGVVRTQVGYTGGKTERPTYEQVCYDATGHAEVVQVEFDPAKVTYQTLLEVFFENHDPTTLDRQGPDVGDQYRSVVFVHSDEQQKLARSEKERRVRSGDYVGPIVTAVEPAPTFWAAEEYHQKYFQKAGLDWACHTGNGKKPGVASKKSAR
jgi:peptide-methionine (S)-S-oxide reductase